MLKVQEYLRGGKSLEDLKAEFGIGFRVNSDLNVVCLNYSQFESPISHPLVQECRSLTLELDSWDIKAWAFPRFFNYGEGHIPADFDWENFKTTEKLDGSLITLWHHNTAGWQVSTRSVPDGSTPVGDFGMTFYQLVLQALSDMGTSWEALQTHLDPNYCYVCELLCEENQVVVRHSGRNLVLLAIRDLCSNTELDVQSWSLEHPEFPLPIVKLYEKFSQEAIREFVQTRHPLQYEGFVLMDSKFNRVKLKSDAYCLISHQVDGLGRSNRSRLELLLSGKTDDVLSVLPKILQSRIVDLQGKLLELVSEINLVYSKLKDIELQKDFAGVALTYKYSAVLFALRGGRIDSAMDWFKTASPKSTLDWMKVPLEDVEN